MWLRNPESAAFAVDIPSVGVVVGVEPGETFEVEDVDVAEQLIAQGFELADLPGEQGADQIAIVGEQGPELVDLPAPDPTKRKSEES